MEQMKCYISWHSADGEQCNIDLEVGMVKNM